MIRNIRLQVAIPENIPGILHVRRTTWLSTYPNEEAGITRADIDAKIAQKDFGAAESWVKRLQEDHLSRTWIAVRANVVIGFLSARKSDDRNRIMAIYIIPKYQKQGIGTALMDAALAWLGPDRDISLEVVSYNAPAIRFYEKYGFCVRGPTVCEAGELPGGKHMPEIEMVRPSGLFLTLKKD